MAVSGFQREANSRIDNAEFARRRDYVVQNYRFCQSVSTPQSFNDSLRSLRAVVAAGAPATDIIALRLDLELWIVLKVRLGRLALKNGRPAEKFKPSEVLQVAREVVSDMKLRRGRPRLRLLAYHVRALMVLDRELTGKEIRARLRTPYEYAPEIVGERGEAFYSFVKAMEPTATLTAIVNIVEEANASKELERIGFLDLMPVYNLSVEAGTLSLVRRSTSEASAIEVRDIYSVIND